MIILYKQQDNVSFVFCRCQVWRL